jgi:hypothetical protein
MSGAFNAVYRLFFRVPVHDPSCPYLLINRAGLEKILSGNVGILKQGFWWEFLARAVGMHLRIVEAPVRHRSRASGVTQVYRPAKVPRIAAEHLLGLYRLRRELGSSKNQIHNMRDVDEFARPAASVAQGDRRCRVSRKV